MSINSVFPQPVGRSLRPIFKSVIDSWRLCKIRRIFHIMIGTKLAHYEITSHLGSGGMGEVYQAMDSKLGRSVAIKLLPEAFASDAERLSRFGARRRCWRR